MTAADFLSTIGAPHTVRKPEPRTYLCKPENQDWVIKEYRDGVQDNVRHHTREGEVNHSPTGHSWGYGGSGPRQLAYDILVDYTGEHTLANGLSWYFVRDVITAYDMDKPFVLDSDRIDAWLKVQGVEVLEKRDLKVVQSNYHVGDGDTMVIDVSTDFADEITDIADLVKRDPTAARSKLLGMVYELTGVSAE